VRAKSLIEIPKETFARFGQDDAMMLAAALAFYSALSFAPLLLIALWVAGLLGPETQAQVVDAFRQAVGPEAGAVIDAILRNAEREAGFGSVAGWVGLVALAFSATGVFAQLQVAMNRVWDVRAKAGGIGAWLRKRVLSLGMVLAILFLLLVSLVISTAVQLAFSGGGAAWQALSFGVSLLLYVLLFASIFKVLPDVQIAWRNVWIGALLTALLFAVGKWAIGLYLGQGSVGSAYGAAGSLLVLLVWVYYSGVILFLGAELTQVIARRRGVEIVPDAHAVWESEALAAPK
jgi:membrane protein